jgi:hypothetical protein
MNWLKWLLVVSGVALAPASPGFPQSISIQPQLGCVAPPTGATIFYWNPSVAQGTGSGGSFTVAGVGSPDCLKSASTVTEDTSTG